MGGAIPSGTVTYGSAQWGMWDNKNTARTYGQVCHQTTHYLTGSLSYGPNASTVVSSENP